MFPANGRLKTLTDDELRAEFRDALEMTAEGIRYMAAVWCEMVDRGFNVAEYANPLTELFPLVDSLKLLPDLVVKYGANPALCKAAAELVPEDQEKLRRPGVSVKVLRGNGTTKDSYPLALSEREVRQVFGDGRIRTPDEQIPHVLKVQAVKPPPREADRFLSLDLADVLSPKQIAVLKAEAARQGLSPAGLVRRILVSHRIIPEDSRPDMAAIARLRDCLVAG